MRAPMLSTALALTALAGCGGDERAEPAPGEPPPESSDRSGAPRSGADDNRAGDPERGENPPRGGEVSKATISREVSVPAPKASLSVISPKAGATTPSTVVNVRVGVKGFEIGGSALGEAPQEGVGHLHFALDQGKFDVPRHSGAAGTLAKKWGVARKYSIATKTAITYRDLPPGRHQLDVWLANHDFTDTGVGRTITFSVKRRSRGSPLLQQSGR